MRPKVFVAQPIPEPALNLMRQEADVTVYPYMDRQITVDELAAAARRSDWLFVLHETKVSAEVLNANPNLTGVGAMARFDPDIDMETANRLSIPVIVEDPADGYHGVHLTTADLTVAMILGLAYRLIESDQYTRCGKFRQEQTMALMGLGCAGKSVGLIGMGKVARHMVPRLRAFEMRVLYVKRSRLDQAEERDLGVEWAGSLDDLLTRSDYVSVLCDYNESTHKLLGRREFELIGPQGYLINTGRGRIVDEPEMIRALEEGRIAGAALDVYWNEPPHTADPEVPEALCRLPNVILAPHNGGATIDVRTSRTLSVASGMVSAMRGKWPPTVLNPQVLKS
jgi:glyoxylate reductase